MNNTLTAALGALRHADGKPDVLARRSELDDLIDHGLSSSEIRHLRARLNAIDMNKDICMHLPIELLMCVVEHLDLEDIMKARSVSRAWNERFSSPDFCLGVIKLHFRSTWEASYKSLDSEAQQLAKMSLSKWLPRAAVDRFRRRRGQYRSVEWYFSEGASSDDPVESQYSHGRVAFKIDTPPIVVLSLNPDASPQVFMDPDRQPIGPWLLSDQFLIAQKSHPKHTVMAWDFNRNYMGNVRLPSSIRRMSAYHDKVGLITESNEALVWHIGGPLKQLDTANVQSKLTGFPTWGASTILFHPIDKETSFVFSQAWKGPDSGDNSYTIRLIVEEFTKEQSKGIYHVDIIHTAPADPRRPQTTTFDPGPLSIVVDEDGRCSIGCRPRHDQEHPGPDTTALALFDMYDKNFDTRHPYLPDLPGGSMRSLREQITDMGLASLKIQGRNDIDEVGPIYTVEGDDRFIVLFGQLGCVAGCFEKSVSIPGVCWQQSLERSAS